MDVQQDPQKASDCFLLAGALLMQSGAETYRAEDTMQRMAASQGFTAAKSFVTPTGIFFSVGEEFQIKIAQIKKRSIDLEKIERINEVSRQLTSQQMTIEEAHDALQYIERTNFFLNSFWQVFFAALASSSFVTLFMGKFVDMPAAAVAGGLGYTAFLLFNKITKVKFFAEFAASIVIGMIAVAAVKAGLGLEVNKIIISAVMPLVPGVLITNAVRDLMAGHFVSGLAKGAEGSLTALSIGSGIAVVLSF